jgi:hypothetical protein
MRKILIVVFVLMIGILLIFQNNISNTIIGRRGNDSRDLLLPDLKTEAVSELIISTEGNKRILRFNTTVFNVGNGELRLIGISDKKKQVTKVTQLILTKDKERKDIEVGSFVFHKDHKHWHVENFNQFQLWSLTKNNDLNKKLIETKKMSFCLWDEQPIKSKLKNSPEERVFEGSCDTAVQGISVGWSDTYTASLPGQELDITELEDGKYAVRSIVNVDRKIKESNYDNNSVVAYVEIVGLAVGVFE